MKRKYISTILEYSEEKKHFDEAIKEWSFIREYNELNAPIHDLYLYDEIDPRCICSHVIKKKILIRNKYNGNNLINGSDCIKKLESCNLKHDALLYIKTKDKIIKTIEPIEPTRFNNTLSKIYDEYQNKMQKLFDDETKHVHNFINDCNTNKVTFGKHKDKTYSQLNKNYIKWYGDARAKGGSFQNKKLDDIYKFCFGKEPPMIKCQFI